MEPKIHHQAPKTQPVRYCVFGCGHRADSREHAWPAWALERLGAQGIAGEVDGVTFYEPKRRNLRVRCVCLECNTGWMKHLEDAVLPFVGRMMVDERTSMPTNVQRALAVWALKTAMVFEFTSRREPVFYTDEERRALRTQLAPPGTTAVLLARTTDAVNFYTRSNGAFGDLNGYSVQANVATIAYRALVVQVLSLRGEVLPSGISLNGNREDWSGSYQLLSPAASVTWPPARTIPPGQLDAFHRRFLPEGVS